jgi:hypothetical protein
MRTGDERDGMRVTLVVNISVETAIKFKKLAKSKGVKPLDLIRSLIAEAIKETA